MPLTPRTTLGPYEVTAKIGEGGMGEVYQARDTKLDRDVALKVLPEAFTSDPDRLARFEREAKVLASLNHPNIGSIYGLEEAEGVKALVLELIEGPTLADRIRQGPIPTDEALPIAKQIAEALEAAHEQGVIHRDLKPANVKVKDDGTVKVLDFGLAKAFQPDASDPNMSMSPTISLTAAPTQMGMVIGTAAYMSPEQAKGKPVDKRADIWAFGAVMYEMLTGSKPFGGDDVSEMLATVIKSEPDWDALPTETPAVLGGFLRGCLRKDPRERVRDIGDVRLAVQGLFETLHKTEVFPVASRPQAIWQRPVPAAVLALSVFIDKAERASAVRCPPSAGRLIVHVAALSRAGWQDAKVPHLKKDAPADVVDALRQIEAQADECWKTLTLIQHPANVAVWALLTCGIEVVEREQAARGSNTAHFSPMLKNLGLLLPIAVKWAMKHGQGVASLRTDWTHELASAAAQALDVARPYSRFEVGFQAFHKDRYAAEVTTPTLARFTTPGRERDRQVSAYQKGLRPREGRFAGQRAPQRPPTPAVQEAFNRVLLSSLQLGARSFSYGEPWELWRELLPEYRDRINALTRRAGDLSLGLYRLDEFNAVYAALIAVCAAHDLLCARWPEISRTYPIESAVVVRPASKWVETLSHLSDVAPDKCQTMLSDLTCSSRSIDLHVHPFVPLDAAGDVLALPPPFPLHGRHDENILRVCSQRRPQVYDMTTLEKEEEMRVVLREKAVRYAADGPITLPKPLPDIDLIALDDSSSTVVIVELKWIRKTLRPAELPDRDADVIKGVGQLEKIRQFLTREPAYLQARGRLSRPLSEYEHVFYLLVARDHWLWLEPHEGFAIIEFDAFARVIDPSETLLDAVTEAVGYAWLPVEGRDFFVRHDPATVNGVSIESQVFYSTEPG